MDKQKRNFEDWNEHNSSSENNNWFMRNLEKLLGLIWCVVVRKKTWKESLVSVMYSKVSFYSIQQKKVG